MQIEIDGNNHIVGNEKCTEGWCDGITGVSGYPLRHKGCGGLVHAEFGDENSDGDYWLNTECDKCGKIGLNLDDGE